MTRLNNEKGNSLLTVFLTITIFSLLFLTFMGQFFTSVKQNQVVEKQSKSVALAEMGVSYIEAAITDIYNANQSRVNDEILEQIEKDVPEKSNEYYADEALKKMDKYLQDGLADAFNKEISANPFIEKEVNSDSAFVIKAMDIDQDLDGNQIIISFVSEGVEDGKKTPLGSKIYINIIPKREDQGNLLINLDAVSFNNIPKPGGLLGGLLTDIFKLATNLVDETIYSTKKLDLDGTSEANSLTNVKLHSEKDMTLKDINFANNLLLETNGKATIDDSFSATNSTLLISNLLKANGVTTLDNTFAYIGNNLELSSDLIVKNNSFVYIGNNLIGNGINISSGAKLCVKNNLNAGPVHLDTRAKLIVENQIHTSGITGNISGVYSGATNFKNMCAVLPYDWVQQINNDVDYNYKE
jgi:hypothetical protein